MAQLLKIVIRRRQILRRDKYRFLIWWICVLDNQGKHSSIESWL